MTKSNSAAYYAWNGQDRDRPANRLYAQLLRREARGGPFLDWGCGTGWLVRSLARRGISAGLEPSQEAASIAQLRCTQSQIATEISELPNGYFKAVSAIHVVEHLNDVDMSSCIEDWKLKSMLNSTLLIATPDADGEAAQIMGSNWRAYADNTHISLHGHTYWRRLLLEFGYQPIVEGSDGLWDTNYPFSMLRSIRNRSVCAASVVRGKLLAQLGRGESYIGVWKRVN